MNPVRNEPQFDRLRDILLPVLAEAVVGQFDVNVPLQQDASWEFNQILVGVQVLLEVIREQQLEIQSAEDRAMDARRRTTDILARVLESSALGFGFDSEDKM